MIGEIISKDLNPTPQEGDVIKFTRRRSEDGNIYPYHLETTKVFKNGVEIFFRPIKPYDTRRIQKMFYSLSEKSIHNRYHGAIKILSYNTAQTMTNIDYNKEMVLEDLIDYTKRSRRMGS